MFQEASSTTAPQKILLIVTGSIAAYKAIELTSLLSKAGHQVQVLLSHSALRFVGEAAFEALSGRPVLSNLWQSGDLLGHIHWLRWADLIAVAPATAEFIAQLAQGHARDYPTTLSLAHQNDKPFFIFPAMNPSMWSHPATQHNVSLLRQRGYLVISPDSGFMACGEEGAGRLLEPINIQEVIFSKIFLANSTIPPQALVTSGGTQVPLDGVRHLGNFSSGRTGWQLTLELLRLGYQVDWIHAKWIWGNCDPQVHLYESHGHLRRFEFQTPDELESHLKTRLEGNRASHKPYRLLWHLAAISDFDVQLEHNQEDFINPKPINNSNPSHLASPPSESVAATTKLDSKTSYVLRLIPRRKTLQWMSPYLHPSTCLVAWKLTGHLARGGVELRQEQVREKIEKLFTQPQVRYVVHNEMKDYREGNRLFYIYARESPAKPVTEVNSTVELAHKLEALCRRSHERKNQKNEDA